MQEIDAQDIAFLLDQLLVMDRMDEAGQKKYIDDVI